MHLSGRQSPVNAVLSSILEEYRQLHAAMLQGSVPMRAWIVSGCGLNGGCGGLGDRVKALRLNFYLAVLSKRAIFLEDWLPVGFQDVFAENQVMWRAHRVKRDADMATVVFSSSRPGVPPPTFLAAAFSPAARVVRGSTVFSSFGLNMTLIGSVIKELHGDVVNDTVWREVFQPSDGRVLPISAMLDFLFKPEPEFMNAFFIPLVDSLPVWSQGVRRVGVHFRTLAADGM